MNDRCFAGLSMFIHKLPAVLEAEKGVENLVARAQRAGLRSVWIKIAVGRTPYATNLLRLDEVAAACRAADIALVGWHEPRAATRQAAQAEADLVADLAAHWSLAAVVMDAERPEGTRYFQGGWREADLYAERLRVRLNDRDMLLGLCSHDLPANFPGFPLMSFARHAQFNAPQVYYGRSRSVAERLDRAIKANATLRIPFIPIGAAWVGSGGGCTSAEACADRARAFLDLVARHGFDGCGFWHWGGAPDTLWDVLSDRPAFSPSPPSTARTPRHADAGRRQDRPRAAVDRL